MPKKMILLEIGNVLELDDYLRLLYHIIKLYKSIFIWIVMDPN